MNVIPLKLKPGTEYIPSNLTDIDNEMNIMSDKILVHKLLSLLNNREREVFVKYFAEEKSLNEIGDEYNLTRERIRQIKEGAVRRLRRRVKSCYFDIKKY